MTQKSPVSVRIHRAAWLAPLMLACLLLTNCATTKHPLKPMQPPQVRCEERSPTEAAYPLPSGSEDWRKWRAAALAWIGIATAEVEKRATTADCLDRLRESNVIR